MLIALKKKRLRPPCIAADELTLEAGASAGVGSGVGSGSDTWGVGPGDGVLLRGGVFPPRTDDVGANPVVGSFVFLRLGLWAGLARPVGLCLPLGLCRPPGLCLPCGLPLTFLGLASEVVLCVSYSLLVLMDKL